MRYATTCETPLGEVLLASDGAALMGLRFSGQKYAAAGLSPDAERRDDLPTFVAARSWLAAYFAGEKPGVPPALSPTGTPFQRAVWGELLHIPYGQTATYGELAARLNTAARAVGSAVGRNPISVIVPCHRVLGADGQLTGYAGGIWRKRALLALERRGLVVAEEPARPEVLLAELTDVWERSVRATHDFLVPGEVEQLRCMVPGAITGVPRLFVARRHGRPVGFLGLDGASMEMLFVDADARGMGAGWLLMERAVFGHGACEVSVNEENPQAIGFYEHLGFSVHHRTEADEQGAPHPLLVMRRAQN